MSHNHNRTMTPSRKNITTNYGVELGKLPPQATDLEEALLGSLLKHPYLREEVSYLKTENFYFESNQFVYHAITEVEVPTLETVGKFLKSNGKLEVIGGYYRLSTLTDKALNPARGDWAARIILQQWIRREVIRTCSDTIRLAYDDSQDTINLFDRFVSEIESIETVFSPETTRFNVVSNKESEAEMMDLARKGKIQMGLVTGFPTLDEHFRFKPSSFVIVNGTDNSGKTTFVILMAVVSNRLHGWRWILACMENEEYHVRVETIQLASGKPISKLSDQEYAMWYDWSINNFTILVIKDQITAERLMRIAQKINQTNPHQGFLIDPYNALDLDIKNQNQSSHEYHYRVTGLMRNFIKRNNCSIWLNTHAVTEALRRIHKDGDYIGFPMPPEKADVEGGGKFANRADDFLTIHRYNQHKTEFNITQVHVRKIKVTQTGGRPTAKDEPVKLIIPKGYMTFFDEKTKTSPLIQETISSSGSISTPKIRDYDGPEF